MIDFFSVFAAFTIFTAFTAFTAFRDATKFSTTPESRA